MSLTPTKDELFNELFSLVCIDTDCFCALRIYGCKGFKSISKLSFLFTSAEF